MVSGGDAQGATVAASSGQLATLDHRLRAAFGDLADRTQHGVP